MHPRLPELSLVVPSTALLRPDCVAVECLHVRLNGCVMLIPAWLYGLWESSDVGNLFVKLCPQSVPKGGGCQAVAVAAQANRGV